MALSEVELMGECSPLYASFALESFANTCLGFFFVYLSVVITSKSKLKTPARDTVLFIRDVAYNRYKDVMSIVSQWQDMPGKPLDKRFKFCRKVNATICQFSALVSFLAVTRWLHINNVNGFRYLGYSMTCPPMQAELLVLIAPAVPCYRLLVAMSAIVTFLMLITGWIASGLQGDLWTGDLQEWMEGTDSLTQLDVTLKGWMFVASMGALLYLAFIQLPLALLCYLIYGGKKADLPEGFPRLVLLVWITWMCFPLWWSISFEGFKLINSTKWNGIGFVLLNVVSKGGFTISVLRMVRLHQQKGIIRKSVSSADDWLGTFGGEQEASGEEKDRGTTSESSVPPVEKRMSPAPSQASGDAWFTGVLAKYEAAPAVPKTLASAVESAMPVSGEQSLAGCTEQILMEEVMRRLASGKMALVPGMHQSDIKVGIAEGDDEDEDEEPRMMNL
mmetsp:Transcript_32449/g.74150  ORF Transcript_32449/g.74150 Transcript_32449/m.74150 type:complete len:447 (-) Transcript_32449:126-1466(-)